jgi:hypothetical protein
MVQSPRVRAVVRLAPRKWLAGVQRRLASINVSSKAIPRGYNLRAEQMASVMEPEQGLAFPLLHTRPNLCSFSESSTSSGTLTHNARNPQNPRLHFLRFLR